MLIVNNKQGVKDYKDKLSDNKTVGFVPTMGALHKGHLSLIEKCIIENDISAVSIFVNPNQFNEREDYDKYPRVIEDDINLLKKISVDLLFLPEEKEIYPQKDNRIFELDGLDKYMEGKYRKGHFNGVVQVVTRLFDIIEPQKAYFGMKDYQQLAIIKHIVKKLGLNIKIIGCETHREKDGLAMSSRNTRLSDYQKKQAHIIYYTLTDIGKKYRKIPVSNLKKEFEDRINCIPDFRVEYFDIVHPETLSPVIEGFEPDTARACTAVFAGNVRLIDNMEYNS